MNNPVTLGLASTAVGLVNGTIGLLKEARDAARRSEDHDLKGKLNEVFDSVLELKEVIGNLRDENNELKQRLEVRASLKWDTESKLYFAENDPDPFCPACFDTGGRPVRLAQEHYTPEVWHYTCKVCKSSYPAFVK